MTTAELTGDDPEFLTGALRAEGTLDATQAVLEVRNEPLRCGTGMVGQLRVLTPRYSAGVVGAPSGLILKLPPTEPVAAAVSQMFGFTEREALVYRNLGPRLPLRLPRCYWTHVDPESHAAHLLLEDLRGWRTVAQIDGADAAVAGRAMDAVAALHAATWQRPELLDQPGPARLDSPPWTAIGPAYRAALPAFVERFGHRVPGPAVSLAERIGDRFEHLVAAIVEAAPATLCHGDYRLDNLLFDDTADVPGRLAVLDWQLTHVGPAVGDLAMFLTQSLSAPVRRRHERDLIARWHSGLAARAPEAAAAYPLGAALEHYRLCALYATIAPVAGGGTFDLTDPRATALYATLAERSFAALADLAAAELVP